MFEFFQQHLGEIVFAFVIVAGVFVPIAVQFGRYRGRIDSHAARIRELERTKVDDVMYHSLHEKLTADLDKLTQLVYAENNNTRSWREATERRMAAIERDMTTHHQCQARHESVAAALENLRKDVRDDIKELNKLVLKALGVDGKDE